MSDGTQRASEPFGLPGELVLRNRLVGTAHGAGLVEDGLALPADADYWRRRAAGGAAMLTVGGTVTAPESTWRRRIVTEAWREEAIPGMARRAHAIRSEGAVAACQLVHLGRETTGAEMWFAPVAPSAVRSPREPVAARALGDDEIDAIIEGFRASALNAAQAGFQVIELHAAHGYLLAQFLSPVTNRRVGAGDPSGRARIVVRIIEAIRASAPELVIGIRLSTEGGEEAGQALDGLCELLPQIGPHVDYVNLTVGVRTTYVKDMGTEEPPLLREIERVRPLIKAPLLVSQAFRRGAEIERALASGADLVGVARPLIADPDFPAKLLSGREGEIRPCVSCNEDCRAFDPSLLCSVNPELAPAGMASRPALPLMVARAARRLAEEPGPVAIVGAGPAGLECATSLAGHTEVVLFDERDTLGGELAVAAAAPNRHGWQALLDFYERALGAAPEVAVHLSSRITRGALDGFDDVVIACGSEEILPTLPGIEQATSASQAIQAGAGTGAGGVVAGTSVLIVDDGFGSWRCASAIEVAVAGRAAAITVVTPATAFGGALPAEGRVQLLARLRGAPLELRPLTALETLSDGVAQVRNVVSGQTTSVAFDQVIIVGERRPRDWSVLVPANATVHVIGDAVVPRRVAHAVSEGRAAAAAIEQARARYPLGASA